MKLNVDFGQPVFAEDVVDNLQPHDLNDFYCAASERDKDNLFFVLLTSLHSYEESGDINRAAYLSFLIAYYLFIPLTPPGSCLLAQHYIRKAMTLAPCETYSQWQELIRKGN